MARRQFEPGYETDVLNELDWMMPEMPVVQGQQGSVTSVHLGKHQGEDPEQIAVALTELLKTGKKLTKKDWYEIIRRFQLNPEENNFLEVQPGGLRAFYNMALKFKADGIIPYYDGAGYSDIVAIKGKVTVLEVRKAVFHIPAGSEQEKEDEKDLAENSPTEEEKRFSFGPRYADFVL